MNRAQLVRDLAQKAKKTKDDFWEINDLKKYIIEQPITKMEKMIYKILTIIGLLLLFILFLMI